MSREATVERGPAVAGLERTVVRGSREAVMTALGEEHREEIRALREGALESWPRLVARTTGGAHDVFRCVQAASRERLPLESEELACLAAGSGLPDDDVWALNLRGDLGSDGTGCSDVAALVGGHPVMAHNEDGGTDLVGRIRLVTLDIEGDPSMTAVWYPGMLPANAFVVTSAGLGFGMDHLPVVRARPDGAGRHLVARHAQRGGSGAQAVERLTSVPCAGGFSFNMADTHGQGATMVENIAGEVAVRAPTGGHTERHTNHARFVPPARRREPAPDDKWLVESRARAERLRLHLGDAPVSPQRMLTALRAEGVCNRGEGLWTYVTALVDGCSATVTLVGDSDTWTCDLDRFATGEWSGSPGAAPRQDPGTVGEGA